jgi:uncharacterized protein
MPEQLLIDALALARRGEQASGQIRIADLLRLCTELRSKEGEVSYSVRGALDGQRKPSIDCIIAAQLELTCQRCLGALTLALRLGPRFHLVAGEQELPRLEDEEEDVDYLVAGAHLDLRFLVEDELLLALPIAPMHEQRECTGAGVKSAPEGPPTPASTD